MGGLVGSRTTGPSRGNSPPVRRNTSAGEWLPLFNESSRSSNMSQQQTAKAVPVEQASIPDKLYFKIGEVSSLVGVKPYVLRYWETEFKEISPVKSRTKQRLYRRKDVELILKIRNLLYSERFTINGARKKLKVDRKSANRDASQLGLNLATSSDQSNFSPKGSDKILQELKMILRDMETSLRDN